MKELVLTGLPVFWPEDESHALFLGPWCFAGHPRHRFWDQTRFTLAPSPWRSKQDVLNASIYVDSLVDRIFPALTDYLNKWHGTDYSERFWRICLIRWLVHWVGIAHERFRRLAFIGRAFPEQCFRVKVIYPWPSGRPRDLWDFALQFPDHKANLILFSRIIHLATFPFLEPVFSQDPSSPLRTDAVALPPPVGQARRQGWKIHLRNLLGGFWGAPFSSLDYVRGISWSERLSLLPCILAKVSDESQFPRGGDGPTKTATRRFPDNTLRFDAGDLFEEIISKIILEHLPQSALDIPHDLFLKIRRTRIWVGSDTWDSGANYGIASVVESGGRWLAVQHGAGYGQNLSLPQGKIEYETPDGFISWGWRTQKTHRGTVYPLPSRELSRLPRQKERRRELVFVGRMVPAYSFRLHSILFPEDLLPYLMNKRRFFRTLNPEILSSIHYRAYPEDYGVGEREWVGEVLRPDQICDNGSLCGRMNESRLVVVDHLGTSIQECMAMNAPVICFWEPEHFRESEAARGYFDRLRAAGILHNCPEDAGKKVNEVWESVREWWEGEAVREAREQFRREYALTSRTWRRDWVRFMKDYIIRRDAPHPTP